MKNSCPFSLQVSWKLHQLLVRPRLKDVFDLIFLLKHDRFNSSEREKILYALKKECKRDGFPVTGLLYYLDGRSVKEKKKDSIKKYLVRANHDENLDIIYDHDYKHFTNKEHFPFKKYSDILGEFQEQLLRCGFSEKNISA